MISLCPCHDFPLAFRTFPAIKSMRPPVEILPALARNEEKRADRSLYCNKPKRRSISTCATDSRGPTGGTSPKGGFMKGIVSSRQYPTPISRRSSAPSALRRGGKDAVAAALLLAGIAVAPAAALAASNPVCPAETVFFNPGHGQDIVVPSGFEVSVFAKGLNFPTAVAFRGDERRFEVFVLESGHGLPSRCNDETSPVVGGEFSATNPFTPDILVFNQSGNPLRGPLAKPTTTGAGLQPHGPA